ncbi:MAG: 4-hydroxy-3-methylbut-2-enyl diphosphate reductase [Gammaproteobacteria bacterium]|nr:4-hydroxy-3-methylbut-2-enyl diphosphate reductase [Gammaproteobacteria bacterium]
MEVLLANPRGFCAGVDRAIEIVERALETLGPPIYVRHEVVHNRFVVETLRGKGAVFVEELKDVPDGAVVIFSAHGVSRAVREEARQRRLKVLDATCPLVTKVHLEVVRNSREGLETILVGHRGHPEVAGTMGQCDEGGGTIHLVETVADARAVRVRDPARLAFVTQTTLSVDDTADIVAVLERRFPGIRRPRKDDICYATQNRQNAVKQLVGTCDLILIVGSRNSSNSNRLLEIALKRGVEAHLIDGAAEIKRRWLDGKRRIGLSAGASAPETLVQAVVAELQSRGAHRIGEVAGIEETVTFPLPKELRPGGDLA